MGIDRRKFFRVCAAGMAATAIPAFLQGDKVQGKIIVPDPLPTPNGKARAGFYAWQEQGVAMLDNRRVILGSFDNEPDIVQDGLWNIKEGRDHDMESLTQALKMPIRRGVMSKDVIDQIYEMEELIDGASVEFPLDLLHHEDEDLDDVTYQKFDPMYRVQVPTYDVGPIDPEVWEKVRKQKQDMMDRIILRGYGPEYGKPNRNDDIFVMPERGDMEITVGLDTKTNEAKKLS